MPFFAYFLVIQESVYAYLIKGFLNKGCSQLCIQSFKIQSASKCKLCCLPARLLGKLEIFWGAGSEIRWWRKLMNIDSSESSHNKISPHIPHKQPLQISRIFLHCLRPHLFHSHVPKVQSVSVEGLSLPSQFLITSGYFLPIPSFAVPQTEIG